MNGYCGRSCECECKNQLDKLIVPLELHCPHRFVHAKAGHLINGHLLHHHLPALELETFAQHQFHGLRGFARIVDDVAAAGVAAIAAVAQGFRHVVEAHLGARFEIDVFRAGIDDLLADEGLVRVTGHFVSVRSVPVAVSVVRWKTTIVGRGDRM